MEEVKRLAPLILSRPSLNHKPKPPRPLTQTLFALLSLPINVVSGLLRFLLGILRIPLSSLSFTNNATYRGLRQAYPNSRGATRRWITALEEETGAVSFKCVATVTSGLDTRPSTSRRNMYPPTSRVDGTKILPDFFDGTYEEVLDICHKEGKIACVILVSDEHDDVAEFKRSVVFPFDKILSHAAARRSTLTDPGFVRVLTENNFVVWGGDVRDKVSWDG
jgi:FAS-associated factor 2